ncbi:hypothetical protein [Methanosarcina acetivorans]|nr:hypothetical protein [Methanosarcina acetivorans]
MSNQCKYKNKCAHYRTDSFTCTKELSKTHCGIFLQFCRGVHQEVAA